MKKLLTLATITATILCFGSVKTNEYYTNNGDVQHVRIGSLGANSFVLSDINLYSVYESKTNAQKNIQILLDILKSSNLNTSNEFDSVIKLMTNNFEEVRSDIILLENKINNNYINQNSTNTFLHNEINGLELDLNNFKNTYNTNYFYVTNKFLEIDSKILDLNNKDTNITNTLSALDNSLFILSTNIYTKSEVDNSITNVLSGMVFDISSLEKVQETLNIIILKLGGSVTNNVVVP